MRLRHTISAFLAFAVFGIAVWQTQSQQALAPSPATTATTTLATTSLRTAHADQSWYPVVRVVDGDTLIVDERGQHVTIRVIGLDTPETVDPRKPVQCFGREASAEAHRLLDGQTVRLEYDASQGTFDKYGRTLAYIFLPDGRSFEQTMIAEGYGHEYTYRLPYQYQAAYKAAEKDARENLRGLWSPNTCAGNSAKLTP